MSIERYFDSLFEKEHSPENIISNFEIILNTSFILGTCYMSIDMLKYFIQKGCSINYRVNKKDLDFLETVYYGLYYPYNMKILDTPLLYFVRMFNDHILFVENYDVYEFDEEKFYNTLEFLLKNGANPYSKDYQNKTILDYLNYKENDNPTEEEIIYRNSVIKLINKYMNIKSITPLLFKSKDTQKLPKELTREVLNTLGYGYKKSLKRTNKQNIIRSNPELWKSIVEKYKKSNKGGRSGQWSARKAQLAVQEYKRLGGTYHNKKDKNNSLVKWTRQKWRTKSGKPSVQGSSATGERYLPEKVIQNLTNKEYKLTTMYKRKALRKGIQYSKNPRKLLSKIKKYKKV